MIGIPAPECRALAGWFFHWWAGAAWAWTGFAEHRVRAHAHYWRRRHFGYSTQESEELLAEFERSQATFEDDSARLQKKQRSAPIWCWALNAGCRWTIAIVVYSPRLWSRQGGAWWKPVLSIWSRRPCWGPGASARALRHTDTCRDSHRGDDDDHGCDPWERESNPAKTNLVGHPLFSSGRFLS